MENRSNGGWCAVVLSVSFVAGVAYVVHRLTRAPTHRVIEATQVHDDHWTAHLIRVGPWSQKTRKFKGPTQFEFELIGPEGAIYRFKTHTSDPGRAADLMDDKLAELRESAAN